MVRCGRSDFDRIPVLRSKFLSLKLKITLHSRYKDANQSGGRHVCNRVYSVPSTYEYTIITSFATSAMILRISTYASCAEPTGIKTCDGELASKAVF
jgi:hypothetical protein